MGPSPFPLADYRDAYPKNQKFLAIGNRSGKIFAK